MSLKINLECDFSNGFTQGCMCPIGMELTTFQKNVQQQKHMKFLKQTCCSNKIINPPPYLFNSHKPSNKTTTRT